MTRARDRDQQRREDRENVKVELEKKNLSTRPKKHTSAHAAHGARLRLHGTRTRFFALCRRVHGLDAADHDAATVLARFYKASGELTALGGLVGRPRGLFEVGRVEHPLV